MSSSKQAPEKNKKKRPILITILCYVLLVEAWFYFQVGHLSAANLAHVKVSAHAYGNLRSLMNWLSVTCVISSIGLFFMSKIGYYLLLGATVVAAIGAMVAHLSVGLVVPMFLLSALAFVFRKQYRWFG